MLHHRTVSNLMQGFNRILFNTATSCFSSKPCTMSRNIHAYQKCFSRGVSLLFNLDAVVAITNVKTNQSFHWHFKERAHSVGQFETVFNYVCSKLRLFKPK